MPVQLLCVVHDPQYCIINRINRCHRHFELPGSNFPSAVVQPKGETNPTRQAQNQNGDSRTERSPDSQIAPDAAKLIAAVGKACLPPFSLGCDGTALGDLDLVAIPFPTVAL